MNHDEARRLLNSELKLRAQRWCTDAEFGSALRRFGPDYELGEENDFAEQAADFILFSRDVIAGTQSPSGNERQAREVESVESPEWWTAEWQRGVDVWMPAEMRDDVRRRFGLLADDGTSPRSCRDPQEMLGVLRAARARERIVGRQRFLPLWHLRRLDEGAQDLAGTDWEVWDGGAGDRDFDAQQPLYYLAGLVDVMRDQLGTRGPEAFGLMFMDKPVAARWIDIEPMLHPTIVDMIQYIITVWSPMVPSTEVARAYANARRRDFGDAKEKRAPRLWPLRAAVFMHEWEQQGTPGGWKAAFDEFARRYPGQPYRTMRTFRQAVYDRRRKDAQ